MEHAQNSPIQRRNWKDYAKMGGLLTFSYGTYFSILQYGAASSEDMIQRAVLPLAIFAALRVSYAKEVPYALCKIFTHAVIARQRKSAPPEIEQDFQALCAQAGMQGKAKLLVYEKGIKNNAFALDDTVYLSQSLVDKLDKDELRYVMAHEISHLAMKDNSEFYLTWPPYCFAAILALATVLSMGQELLTDPKALIPDFSTLYTTFNTAVAPVLFIANYYGNKAARATYSRIIEKWADRNAMNLTKDFKSAARALLLLDISHAGDAPPWRKAVFTSHPQGWERIEAMEAHIRGDEQHPESDAMRERLMKHLLERDNLSAQPA